MSTDDTAGLRVAYARIDPCELPSPDDPMAVARQFIEDRFQRGEHVILRRWRGGWWSWHTSHWVEHDEARVRGWAYRYCENAEYTDTSGKNPKTVSWSPTRYKVANLLEALAAIVHLPDDVHPPQAIASTIAVRASELVSVQNGLLHVPTRELHPHDAGLFNVVSVPFKYDPTIAVAPRWLAFLDELWPDDPDSIAALQEFFGYVISGRTDLHKIMLLVGPTRAGKGVIARILKALVGARNCAGPTLASLGTNFGLSPLIGKPLAIISDARLGGANVHQVVERLLSVSGEDMLTIDRKYREPWTGTLSTRFLVISNELPRFGDASGAIANRFVVLTLSESWLGRENPALTSELLPELPAILNWALDGLERLATTGRFTEPASSRDAIVALQDLVSPVAAFVRDRCERGPFAEIECQTLYTAWKGWAEDTGHRPGSLQTFGRDLRAVIPGLKIRRPRDGGDRTRCYQGIALLRNYNGRDRGPSWTSDGREPGEEG